MLKHLTNIPAKLYLPLFYIIAGILIYFLLEKIIAKLFSINLNYVDINKRRQKTLEVLFKNIIKYLVAFIVIIAILNAFAINTVTLLAGFGILSLVIGFALQDILKDFLSGLFIIFDNKYDVGDVVSIDGYKGEVIFLGLKSTRLKSIEGDIKIILNRNITEVINYSLSASRVVLDIALSNDLTLLEMEKTLTTICQQLPGKIEHIIGDILLLGVDKIDHLTTTFRVVVQSNPLKHPQVQRALIKNIKLSLDKHNIKVISITGRLL